MQTAKKFASYSISGFIICLIAFVAVHASIWVIGGKNQNNWWRFECEVNTSVISQNPPIAKTPKLLSEIEDGMQILTNISNLSDLISSTYKTALLNADNLSSENLRQDLLSMNSGDKIKLFLAEKGATEDELIAYIKLSNGFIDKSTKGYDLDKLTEKFQNVADLRKDDGDLTIQSDNKDNLPDINGSYWGQDPGITDKLNSLVGYLDQNSGSKNIVASKDARSDGSLNECIDSGGDWKEFRNECLARTKNYGRENLNCSTVYNPTMGCQCPTGKILINGKCGDSSGKTSDGTASEQENRQGNENQDYPENNPDNCSGTYLFDRTCPATRCEGNNLVTYPPSGKDTCQDGNIKYYSCTPTNKQYNAACEQMKETTDTNQQQDIAKKDPNLYKQLQDYFKRSDPSNNPDNWGKSGENSSSGSGGGSNNESGSGGNKGNSGNTGSSDNTGNTGNTGDTGNSGDRTSGNNTSSSDTGGKMPPDQGMGGDFNPTPSFTALAECLGFKDRNGDGKVDIPYNGVMVNLLNKDDPTNDKHPNQNVSRMVYLDRNGNIRGNNGDINSGGLKVGAWSKGSGGTAWASKSNGKYGPEWIAFNAQTTHTNSSGQTDPWSFKSGAGLRVGPNGEGLSSNGDLNSKGKPQGMSGCNIHSGNNRNHSRGCETCGGNERKGLFNYIKKMASKDGGKILMASIPVDNTDQNSQSISSEFCGQMSPDKAIQSFDNTSQFKGWNPY